MRTRQVGGSDSWVSALRLAPMSERARCSRLAWLLTPLVVISAACTGSSNPLEPPPPSPQACRTYATQWVSTSTFGQPVSTSASFNAATGTLTENSPAGSSQVVRRTVYQSVADFIDEPGILGRVLYLRTESCANASNCAGELAEVEIPTYDSQRRRTSSTLGVNGATLLVEAYSAWDSQGRPTTGTRTQPGLCVAPLSLMYDDVARTITVAPAGLGSGILCLGVYFTSVQSYDADGNLISDTGSAGGTSTTTTHTITATARLCK
jgi:hypothetical protein